VYECVEELLKVRNLIAIKGNHDERLNQFILNAYHPAEWRQGGAATARSYLRLIGKENRMLKSGSGYKTALNPADIPETHRQFFNRQHLYYIDGSNNCYVHGGFDRHQPFKGKDLKYTGRLSATIRWGKVVFICQKQFSIFDFLFLLVSTTRLE
jgi:serine/threonine protein phosphatase 1